MAIVTPDQLRHRLGSPTWSPEARADAALILDEVEGELAGMLQAPVSPLALRSEKAVILDTGLVCPSYPIYSLVAIDGVDVADPLDEPWLLEGGWLKKTDVAETTSWGSNWNPTPSDLDPYGPVSPSAHHAYGAGTVLLRYRPGWGEVPAIRAVIMEVARNRFTNRHDDTVVARDLTTDNPAVLPEEITPAIFKRVELYKWHHAHR